MNKPKICQVTGKSDKEIFKCLFSTQLSGMSDNAWSFIGPSGRSAFSIVFKSHPEGVTMDHIYMDARTRNALKKLSIGNFMSRTNLVNAKIKDVESKIPMQVSTFNRLQGERDLEGNLPTPKFPTVLEPEVTKYLRGGRRRTNKRHKRKRRKTNKRRHHR